MDEYREGLSRASVHHTNMRLAFRSKTLTQKTGWDGSWLEILVRDLEKGWYLGKLPG